MECKNCKSIITDKSNFCNICGTKVTTEIYNNAVDSSELNLCRNDILCLKTDKINNITTIKLKQGSSIDVKGLYFLCHDSMNQAQILKCR